MGWGGGAGLVDMWAQREQSLGVSGQDPQSSGKLWEGAEQIGFYITRAEMRGVKGQTVERC